MARPGRFIDWVASAATATEPPEDLKRTGWAPNDVIADEHINWLLRHLDQWQQHNSLRIGAAEIFFWEEDYDTPLIGSPQIVTNSSSGVIMLSSTGGTETSVGGGTWTTKAAPGTTGDALATDHASTWVSGGTSIATSTNDGTSWTASTWPSAATAPRLDGIAYGAGEFVGVGLDGLGGHYIARSLDGGANWADVLIGAAGAQLRRVVYGDGTWVAVGDDTGGDALIFSATDTSSWTERANPKAFDLNSVAYGNGLFVAVGDPDGTDAYIVTSPDGTTWTERANPQNDTLQHVLWTGTIFLAVGGVSGTSPYAVYSFDGITWEEIALPTTIGGSLTHATVDIDGRVFAVELDVADFAVFRSGAPV